MEPEEVISLSNIVLGQRVSRLLNRRRRKGDKELPVVYISSELGVPGFLVLDALSWLGYKVDDQGVVVL